MRYRIEKVGYPKVVEYESNGEKLKKLEIPKEVIVDEEYNVIGEEFDLVFPTGLVSGDSDYFIAKKGGKWAIYDREGSKVSDDFDWIWDRGLVRGESEFYVAKKNGKVAIYQKMEGKTVKITKDFEDSEKVVYELLEAVTEGDIPSEWRIEESADLSLGFRSKRIRR